MSYDIKTLQASIPHTHTHKQTNTKQILQDIKQNTDAGWANTEIMLYYSDPLLSGSDLRYNAGQSL
jgi:hypothetical protein